MVTASKLSSFQCHQFIHLPDTALPQRNVEGSSLLIVPIGAETLRCFTLPSALAHSADTTCPVKVRKAYESPTGILQSLLMPSLHGVASILAVEKMMERLKRLTHGDLSQSELEVIKRVFDLATTQSWFDDTPYSREGFAAALVDLFRCGMVNPAQLERIAMFWALSDFSHSMSSAQRAKLRSLYSRCEVEQ